MKPNKQRCSHENISFTWNIEAFSSISKISSMSTDTSILIFEEFLFDGGRGAICFWQDLSGLIRRQPTSSLLSLQSVRLLHLFSISMHSPLLQANSVSLQVEKVNNADSSSLQFLSFLKLHHSDSLRTHKCFFLQLMNKIMMPFNP